MGRMLDRLRRRRINPAYAFLFDPPPPDECVAVDCETTGLDRRRDDIVTIAAVRIRGARILMSEAFTATLRPRAAMKPDAIKVHGLRSSDVSSARAPHEAIAEFLRFVGSRPLVGYFLEFDVAMLDRQVRSIIGASLPNARIETSALYYERKYSSAPPGTQIDLSFAAMMRDLGLPVVGRHDALSDALMTATAYLALKDRKERGVRIPRGRPAGGDPFKVGG